MALSTTDLASGSNGLPKTIAPGNHELKINNIKLDEFRFINKELGKHSNIIWKVIVNNNPATKERMDELRDALDKLILYFDI